MNVDNASSKRRRSVHWFVQGRGVIPEVLNRPAAARTALRCEARSTRLFVNSGRH